MRLIWQAGIVVILTVLTQLGGAVWLVSRLFRRPVLAFLPLYALCVLAAWHVAPHMGRVPMACTGDTLRMQSPLYCALMRNYVAPELAEVAQDGAAEMAARHPGTVTLALDGGFPFFDGFPLLPHLSHDDGDKLDLAFYYTDAGGRYLPGRTRSPLGYFAFETLEEATCPPVWPTLRWDLRPLQALFADRPLDPERTRDLLQILVADARVDRIFLEPALAARLGLDHPAIRFQGCRAARHDDHLHLQIRPD